MNPAMEFKVRSEAHVSLVVAFKVRAAHVSRRKYGTAPL